MPDFNKVQTYDYHLPQELIAQYPLEHRSASRLLCLQRTTGQIEHRTFTDLKSYLKSGDVLVVNSTKVFPARLFATKDTGARLEVFLLHNVEGKLWHCLINPGKRIRKPQWLHFSERMKAYVYRTADEGIFAVELECDGNVLEEIERIGHVPLPPYIHREDKSKDRTTYQTVYARQTGSVAAPTAGFHFTDELLQELIQMGVIVAHVLLHVGLGTFKPVATTDITDHKMHSEYCTIEPETAEIINLAKAEQRRVIAVGTTSVRTLESFWNPVSNSLESGYKWTDIFLYPGKSFNVIDALVTNFHLPQSTLLMLVSAFAGYDQTMQAYQQAIEEKYRFFSYGDAMYIY